MITNNKKNKEVKFHKVKTQNFNNAKKYKINKSSRTSALDNLLKNVDEQYSLENKKICKISKKLCSSKQINLISNKILALKEKEKNLGKTNISAFLKNEDKKKKLKKYNSSKNLHYIKNIINNNNLNSKKNKLDKKNKKLNINENDKNDSYIINNELNQFIERNDKENKENKENKEENKNNDDTHDKERADNIVETIKNKFLCCF